MPIKDSAQSESPTEFKMASNVNLLHCLVKFDIKNTIIDAMWCLNIFYCQIYTATGLGHIIYKWLNYLYYMYIYKSTYTSWANPENLAGGWGGVLKTLDFLVFILFHRGPYKTPSRSYWTRRDPIASRGGVRTIISFEFHCHL